MKDASAPDPATPPAIASGRRRLYALAGLFLLQGVCALFFAGDVALDIAGLDAPEPGGGETEEHVAIEALVSLALVLGVGFTAWEMRALLTRQRRMEDQIRAASGALLEVIEAEFDRWRLTPSERDVALLSIKGLAIAEIAAARGTRPGTVKAQLNAIYAKAGVSGRHELLSRFIEELMGGPGARAA
jgi:DNA-binding CsgD family transcriptional regulator